MINPERIRRCRFFESSGLGVAGCGMMSTGAVPVPKHRMSASGQLRKHPGRMEHRLFARPSSRDGRKAERMSEVEQGLKTSDRMEINRLSGHFVLLLPPFHPRLSDSLSCICPSPSFFPSRLPGSNRSRASSPASPSFVRVPCHRNPIQLALLLI